MKCFRNCISGNFSKVRSVVETEAVGLIYAQFPTKDVDMSWDIPSVQVDFTAGTKILSYMEATLKITSGQCNLIFMMYY